MIRAQYYLHILLEHKRNFLLQLFFICLFYILFSCSSSMVFCMHEGSSDLPTSIEIEIEQLKEQIKEQEKMINGLNQELIFSEAFVKDAYFETSEVGRLFDILSGRSEIQEIGVETQAEPKEVYCNINCTNCDKMYNHFILRNQTPDQK